MIHDFNLTNQKLSLHEKTEHFKCEIYDISYSQRNALKKHKLIIHEKSKPFKCELCDKRFSLKQPLVNLIIG